MKKLKLSTSTDVRGRLGPPVRPPRQVPLQPGAGPPPADPRKRQQPLGEGRDTPNSRKPGPTRRGQRGSGRQAKEATLRATQEALAVAQGTIQCQQQLIVFLRAELDKYAAAAGRPEGVW